MIVRNEEQFLRQCLASVVGLVSEIIVVDTGSSDSSVEIAREFDANVHKCAWKDNFSKPRNFGIAKAKGEWILVLDADEALHIDSHEIIRQLCGNQKLCFLLTQRHYATNPSIQGFSPCRGEFPEMEKLGEKAIPGYFESSLVRLFPNNAKIRYRNRIHELVEPAIKEHSEFKIVDSGIRIHHYGQLKPGKTREDKARLYTNLGKRKATETPTDWKALYELGIEHNCNGRLLESAQAFAKSVELNPHYVNLWVNYGYVLCELREFRPAISALERAITLDASNAEAWCNLGVVYLRWGRYFLAEEAFKAAIVFNKNYVNAWSNLGDTYLNSAMPAKAVRAFENSLTLLPQNDKAREGLGVASLMIGNLARAEKLLMLCPHSPRREFWLGQLRRLMTESGVQKIAG